MAAYLMTCPNSNMIGMYYLPIPTLCHEVGISKQGALKALRSLSEGGFAHYDPLSEYVFVPEMAHYQIGEPLSENDNRVKGIKNELQTMRKCIYFNNFLNRYRESFHLEEISPSEAPCKPLRSQEQEQEQEQENKNIYIGKKVKIDLTHHETYQTAYPGIDLESEYAKMDSWLLSNPDKRKGFTYRFANNWLSKAKESNGNGSGINSNGSGIVGGKQQASGKAKSDGTEYPVDRTF
jgi:hypothetical protein